LHILTLFAISEQNVDILVSVLNIHVTRESSTG